MGSFFRAFERGVWRAFRDPKLAAGAIAGVVVLALVKAREKDKG